jgi:dTDP-4-amino-4,6-dideoxygalactose transaminase
MYERYHHDVVGVNSRLDSIQAAVLNAKLPLLDHMVAQDKMRHVNIQLHLKGIRISAPSICDICDCHVFHQYTLRIVDGDRDGLNTCKAKIFHVLSIIPFHCTHKRPI